MVTAEEIKNLLKIGEGLHLEAKACRDKLPRDVWETYSAFANTRGGVILLGVTEHKERTLDDRFEFSGVSDYYKIITDFFNIVNNRQKVSRSVLIDSDVRPVEIDGATIVYIKVPEADYRQKPIYINNDLQSGTYKRLHEGDRHVTQEELAMLIRDSSDNADGQILNKYGFEHIDIATLHGYRNAFNGHNPGHMYANLSDQEFLTNLGGYGSNPQMGIEGVTAAGLLMFGKSVTIHQIFPNFRFDYLNLIGIEPGSSMKWNDRLTDDGRWVDNIYNFLTLALNKLLLTLPSEGRLKGVIRIDGGELFEGVREGFINTLTYCDYWLGGVLRIDRRSDRIVMRNPGTLRISPERIYEGDYTQARNSTIQKMLRMIGFGDNIGSGFRKILNAWKNLGFPHPDIHEEDDVNEVWLTLPIDSSALNVSDDHVNILDKGEETTDKGEETTDEGEETTDKGEETTDKGEESLHQIPENIRESLSYTQRKILLSISQNPYISFKQLGDELGMTEKGLRVQRAKMEILNIHLVREGSTKSGKWSVEYREPHTGNNRK